MGNDKDLFRLGRLCFTRGVILAGDLTPAIAVGLLTRHLSGDWSEMSKADQEANRQAILDGTRILSAYQVGASRVFIITEADRSRTIVLLASEY